MNVELLTLSEVESVSGDVGNFTVNVRKKPRYIDMNKCIACGLCAEKCPRKVDDEFNMGVNKRKAAYIKYGQAVPLKYAIDGDHCIYLQRGKCRACEKFCPTGAINFEDREETVPIHVGSVILAPGFKPFDPAGLDFYAYSQIPDVVTSLEYERLLSASGPCMGHLVRPSDGREPRKIAWLQCVGSRSTNRCENGYCSSVCCMYSIKQSLVTAEHTAGEGLAQSIFYMDIRSHGKEFERYYESAKASGVRFVRARPHTIDPGPENTGASMRYVNEAGDTVVEDFDMVVLSVGMEPPADARMLAEKFGIELDHYGFAKTTNFDPVTSNRPGIFVTGAFQAPKAIPRSVAEASSAAAEAAVALIQARGTLTHEKSYPRERDIAAEAPRIGVFVCSCGINIAGVVDVKAVADFAETLPNVIHVENNLFTCSADTQDLIAQKIGEHELNRIVVAACTPRTHEPLFQDTLREAGLNPYMIEMANIRNQNAWVHQGQPEKATEKAKAQVRMAVAKVSKNYPLYRDAVGVTQKALVIGGGLAGMSSALGLADQEYETILLEKTSRLGGNAWHLTATDRGRPIRPLLGAMIDRVENHPKIKVLRNAALETAVGSVGNFVSKIRVDGESRAVTYGIAVLATGARESRPDEYLYGQDDRIMTHLEFDARLNEDAELAASMSSAVFIQCVGSRDERRPYCSRVCCTHSVKSAIRLKEANPADERLHPEPGHPHLRRAGGPLPEGPGPGRDLHPVQRGSEARGRPGRRRAFRVGVRPDLPISAPDRGRCSGAGGGHRAQRHPRACGTLQVRGQRRRLPQRGPSQAEARGHAGGGVVPGRHVQLSQAHRRIHRYGQGGGSPGRGDPGEKGDAARRHQVLYHRKVRWMRPLPGCLPLPGAQAGRV